MFERLSFLYNTGKITSGQLDIAVSKGWITADEKKKIIG